MLGLAHDGGDALDLIGEHLARRSLRHDSTGVDADYLGFQPQGFFDIVRHGDDRHATFGGYAEKFGEQGIAGGAVDAVEGLVEQEQLCAGCGEGSGKVDALGLAPGELAVPTLGEGVELEEAQGFVDDGRVPDGTSADLEGEAHIAADIEMRQQGRRLGRVSDIAAAGRNVVKPSGGAVGSYACELDRCCRTAHLKAAHGAEQGTLAAAGRAEEDGPWSVQFEVGGEQEGAKRRRYGEAMVRRARRGLR